MSLINRLEHCLRVAVRCCLPALLLAGCDQAAAQTDAATAEALMRMSGMWRQFESIGPKLHSALVDRLARANPRASAAETGRVTRAVDTAYAPEHLQQLAIAALARDLQGPMVPALQSWFDSETGRLLTQLAAATVLDGRDVSDAVQRGTNLLQTMPAPRRALLTELVATLQAARTLAVVTIDMAVGMQVGLAGAAPGGRPRTPHEMRAGLDQAREPLLQAGAALALAAYADSYASASEGQLQQYLAFLQSPAGRHFVELIPRTLDDTFMQAAEELGGGLATARAPA